VKERAEVLWKLLPEKVWVSLRRNEWVSLTGLCRMLHRLKICVERLG
jgi:hypothetical protein